MKKWLSMVLCIGTIFSLCACATSPASTEEQKEETSDQTERSEQQEEVKRYEAPYERIAGYSMDGELPIAVWVDFDPKTDQVMKVQLVGYGNPVIMDKFKEDMIELNSKKDQFVGKKANEIEANENPLDKAIASATDSYLKAKDKFIIRPYQSMMTERYMANNPYILSDSLSDNIEVKTQILAQYPTDAGALVNEDVVFNEKVTYPNGSSVATFTNEKGEFSIISQVIYANHPGIIILSYEVDGITLIDALDVYENFTTELSGSDAYGQVVNVIDENEEKITYRVLGDKAMNFPGGTCGSTVIDVTISKTDDTISKVDIVEHSDSTYLAYAWEYNGAFEATGDFIYHIEKFTDKFIGLSANTLINPYELTTKENPNGGKVIDGGIDMVVTGATRTPNAIIRAVNAAIEKYSSR